ncbi:SKP1-like protein 4 [Ananas comosus]|uniref:SKP1-like protein n=1 Tax=Ananas comosus TaxID=4615 RepID=A0A199VLZ4_ANACO|nr:SKP1-like protein 4 [Ananas comosus]
MASQDDGAASSLRLLPEEEEQQTTSTVTVTLTSSDGEVFELEAAAARQSALLRHMMELGVAAGGIPLPVVPGHVLALVVEYVRRHSCDKPEEGGGGGGISLWAALHDFDKKFVGRLDQATLIDLLSAADYMTIEGLFDLTCQALADMISGKTIEEIRQTFDEEAELLREISWALG